MVEVKGTIVLTEDDLRKGVDTPKPSVFNFNLTIDQINKAHNIIFVRTLGSLVFLKMKHSKDFKKDNDWIMKTNVDLMR